jgi:D-alanyl-D-alanine carboxypeptidase (penicillin-binding protein 5/6)
LALEIVNPLKVNGVTPRRRTGRETSGGRRLASYPPLKILLYALAFFASIFSLFLSTAFGEAKDARSAVIMEASSGRVLYARNPDLRLPPASTVKLITAILVIEKADPKDVVTISENASRVRPWKAGFRKGDEVTVEELLYAALIKSANDAAVALAEAVAGSEENFVYLMNQKAAAIGAKDTQFVNATGLPGPYQYTTALDLSTIMVAALSYPKLREIIGTPVAEFSTRDGRHLSLKNTDKLLWSDECVIGGKTGYTVTAGHCFVVAAEREKATIIVALLGSPSRNRLWKEAEALIEKGFQMIGNHNHP